MGRKAAVINSNPMESPGIEGVSIKQVLKWHEKGSMNLSPDFQRIIWNSTKDHKCCKCRKPLHWPDFEVDHVTPHSKGGRTDLSNAALICKHCNASKGNRENDEGVSAKRRRVIKKQH